MDDTISRRLAIDTMEEYFARIGKLKRRGLNKGEKAIALDTVGAIKSLPSAQPKMGRWERHYSRPNVYADLCWHCSECGYRSSDNWAYKFNFCPHCGAKMEGEDE